MEYKFINRQGDEILFIREGDTFEMKGGDFIRFIFNLNEDDILKYHAIDPSGGPFISVGMDMEYIDKDLKGLVIESIERNKDGEEKIILKTKLI